MADIQSLSDIDLAALLCSRVCHDVISPVGAIANGLEVLDDEDDASMRDIAMDLIRKSARQASTKLQFCRIAFGAAGSAGAHLDLGDAGDIAKSFFTDDKTSIEWDAPLERVKERFGRLDGMPGHALFVALDGEGEAVGFLHVFARAMLEDAPAAQVQAMAVRADRRRQGIGGSLLAAGEAWARAQGLARTVLYSADGRSDAHALYRARGYVGAGASARFVKSLDA